MEEDILAPKQDENYTETDVFLWANNLVPVKESLSIELFFFNKNYVVYRVRLGGALAKQLQPLFIDGLLDAVLEGAGQGMIVRGFEEAESEENVLQRTRTKNVEKFQEVLNWLKHQEHEIEVFNEQDHDMKRIKGVIARVTRKDEEQPFYIIKSLPQSTMMKGNAAWMFKDGQFVPFDADASLRIPPDNQLLVLDQDMYVFNQTKLSQAFGYDAKKYGIAQQKMNEISKNFSFVFDSEVTMESIVQGKKTLVNKLQKINPAGIKQEALLEHAEELGVDLMTDNNGAIIIMDDKDLTKFVNLLNDDYIESPLTGQKYEIKSKKILKITEEAFGEEVV